MNEEMQKMNDDSGLDAIITGIETMCVEKKNDEEFMLEFQTTPKNSKEYNYRSHKWDCTNQLDLVEYLKKTSYNFKEGGWIQQNDSKTSGYEICVNDEFKDVSNIIYLVVIFGKIIKGGKSKNPLPQRTYGAGTEENWTMKGSPSDTNYVWSQIFRSCIKRKIPVKFYICKVPTKQVEYITSEGGKKYIEISPYEEMEKDLNAHLMKVMGRKIIGEGDLLSFYKE
jgi:hypothetical protein